MAVPRSPDGPVLWRTGSRSISEHHMSGEGGTNAAVPGQKEISMRGAALTKQYGVRIRYVISDFRTPNMFANAAALTKPFELARQGSYVAMPQEWMRNTDVGRNIY